MAREVHSTIFISWISNAAIITDGVAILQHYLIVSDVEKIAGHMLMMSEGKVILDEP